MNFRQLDRAVAKLTGPLRRRVRLMVGRAVLEAVDDSKKVQEVKSSLLTDEVGDALERFQEYGLTSVPFADCEAVAVFVGGNREHGIVIATDDRRYRPKNLNAGDVALYHDTGVRVLVDRDADQVHLGNLPTVFAALSDLVDARIATLQEAIDTHDHITTATVGPSAVPGVIAPTVPSVGALATVAATEVKIK